MTGAYTMLLLYNNLTLNMEGASCYGRAGDWAAVHRHSKARHKCVLQTKATQSLALSFLFLQYTNTHTHRHKLYT